MTIAKNPILTDLPLPIVTPRLILRPAMPGDGAALHAAKEETWAQLNRWMPWAKDHGTPAAEEIVVRESYAKFIRREDMMLFAFEKDSGAFVAGTGLHDPDWDLRRFVIGYWVRESKQGRGYATELTNALLRYAFGPLAATRVSITHAAENHASAKVIAKCGFTREGILRQAALLPDGTARDLHVYSRLDLNGLPALAAGWGD